MVKVIFFASILALMVACTSNQSKHNAKLDASDLDINLSEPQSIKFVGKGAGAGAMLMSSMGPMGVAIGIAIDEGIGKDIHGALLEQHADYGQFIAQSFTQNCSVPAVAEGRIQIEKVEFRLLKGSEDASVVILGQLQKAGIPMVFPSGPLTGDMLVPLSELKQDGLKVAAAIRSRISLLCDVMFGGND